MALVTEGGYDLQALAASLDAVVQALGGPRPNPPGRRPRPVDRGRAVASAVAAVKRALAALEGTMKESWPTTNPRS